ncbi:MAG: cytochrome c-type biogenesis protein CcmH [Caldilineaceae bacterium]
MASLLFAMVVIGALTGDVLYAQENTPTQIDSSNVSADEVSLDEVNAVARELWCPLCSGVRLDACELKACDQMKDVIAIKLAEGEDTDSIRTYFVAQYGPQVLGEPPWDGFNWLAWVLPFVVLAIGGYFLWNTMRRMVRPVSVTATTTSATVGAAGSASVHGANGSGDEYERKLAEELKRYG